MNQRASGTEESRKARQRAAIATRCRALGLDDEARHALNKRVTGLESSRQMSLKQLINVMSALDDLGAPSGPRYARAQKAGAKMVYREVDVIGALLTDQRLPWAYADGIARQMYGIERVEWCDQAQLKGVLAALYKRGQAAE